MNFFQQLAATGNADLTLRIMQKGDDITVNVMPGSKSSTTQPIIITGTSAELDEEFFKTILPGVQEVKGIISNIDAVKKDAEKELDDKKAKKSSPAKKEDRPAAKPKKEKKSKNPVAVEADMFGGEPSKEETAGAAEEHDEVLPDDVEE